MQAIETHYLPYTNTKPSRIVATTPGGHRLVMSKDKAENLAVARYGSRAGSDVMQVHRVVARTLAKSLEWDYDLAGGATKKGFCFVLLDAESGQS